MRSALHIGDIPLKVGFDALKRLGFKIEYRDYAFYISWQHSSDLNPSETLPPLIQRFLTMVQEEQFRRQYFYQVPISTLESMAIQLIRNETF